MSEDKSKELPHRSINDEFDSIDDELKHLKQTTINDIGVESISNESNSYSRKYPVVEKDVEPPKYSIKCLESPIKELEISHKEKLNLEEKANIENRIKLESSLLELEEKRKDKDLARMMYAGRVIFSGVATLAVIIAGLILHSHKDPLGSGLIGAGAAKIGLTTIVERKEKKDD
jgi:hypothetical protein